MLSEDLQIATFYWLGHIYYNIGKYKSCYKIWKKYLENADKSFNPSKKKVDRVLIFLKQYEVVCDK